MRKAIKDNPFLILFFLSPLFIVFGMHGGNLLHSICNNLNINPVGIGNAEWFGFFGGFLGGVGTVIAFIFTIQHNQKSLDITIKENQKQVQYQAELQRIDNEQHILANVISALKPMEISVFYTTLKNMPLTDGVYDKVKIAELSNNILISQEKLSSDKVKVEIQSNIYSNCYEMCANSDNCELGRIRKHYTDTYNDVFKVIFHASNHFLDLIDVTTKNVDAIQVIRNANKIISNSTGYFTDDDIKMAKENILTNQPNVKAMMLN